MSTSNVHKHSFTMNRLPYLTEETSQISYGNGSVGAIEYTSEGTAEYIEEVKSITIDNKEFFIPGNLQSEYFSDSIEDLETISLENRHDGDYAYIVDGEYKGQLFYVNEYKTWTIIEV